MNKKLAVLASFALIMVAAGFGTQAIAQVSSNGFTVHHETVPVDKIVYDCQRFQHNETGDVRELFRAYMEAEHSHEFTDIATVDITNEYWSASEQSDWGFRVCGEISGASTATSITVTDVDVEQESLRYDYGKSQWGSRTAEVAEL